MKEKTFPKIETVLVEVFPKEGGNYYVLQIKTNLRIKHENKWYLTPFFREDRCNNYNDISRSISEMFEKMIIYQNKMKVDINGIDSFGEKRFKLDNNQDEEKM